MNSDLGLQQIVFSKKFAKILSSLDVVKNIIARTISILKITQIIFHESKK